MNKITTFLYSLKQSITNPQYYRDVALVPFGFSFKYLTFLIFILSTISSLILAYEGLKVLPKIPEFKQNIRILVEEIYPEELVLTFENETLSTNVEEPYFIDIPGNIYDSEDLAEEDIFHLIAIDTQADADDFSSYKSLVLLTDKSAVIYTDNSFRLYPYDGIENISINREMYDEAINKLLPYLDYIDPIVKGGIVAGIFIAPFLFTLFGVFEKLFYLGIFTLPLLAFSAITNKSYSYMQLYKMGMHGLTTSIIVTTALSYFGIFIPFIYTIIFLLWMIVVLAQINANNLTSVSAK